MAQGRRKGNGAEPGVVLSRRLRMLADMVTPGNRLADVGCDHAFLSIYLVQAGICPRALAMDVRTGPLEAAKGHVEEAGLGDYIDLRLSDGLAACRIGEADAMVCAGMGGRLMERILVQGMDRAREMRELILQPQSELPQFRAFLREAGFAVVGEDAVFEEGKYYFAMKAVYRGGGACGRGTAAMGYEAGEAAEPESGESGRSREAMGYEAGEVAEPESGESGRSREAIGYEAGEAVEPESVELGQRRGGLLHGPAAVEGASPGEALAGEDSRRQGISRRQLYDSYGEMLLTQRHPVLLQYLLQRKDYVKRLEASLAEAGSRKAGERLREVRRELAEIGEALAFCQEGKAASP